MIIGIGGISRSGKSFLAKKLKIELEKLGKKLTVLDQDDFVLPVEKIPLIRDHINWEVPESIDWTRMQKVLSNAVLNSDIILVEGLMVYWNPLISKQFDFRIFIELDQDTFLERKKIDLRWGKEPDWYIDHIWDSYLIYGRMSELKSPDMIINGSQDFDVLSIIQKIPLN